MPSLTSSKEKPGMQNREAPISVWRSRINTLEHSINNNDCAKVARWLQAEAPEIIRSCIVQLSKRESIDIADERTGIVFEYSFALLTIHRTNSADRCIITVQIQHNGRSETLRYGWH